MSHYQDPRQRRSESSVHVPRSSMSPEQSMRNPRRRSVGSDYNSGNRHNKTGEFGSRNGTLNLAASNPHSRVSADRNDRTSGGSRSLSTTANVELRTGASTQSVDDSSNEVLEYLRTGSNKFAGARFIFEIGIKLEAKPLTIATAANIYHKFWKVASPVEYDIYDVAGTSMFLAVKLENEPKIKTRDIINIIHHTLNRDAPMMEVGNEDYYMYKNGLISHELVILRMLKFDCKLDSPHKYLVHYLQAISFWKGFHRFVNEFPKFMITAWSCLQDFYHHSDSCDFEPEAIAVAAVDLSSELNGVDLSVPHSSGRTWQNVCYSKYKEADNKTIKTKMLEVYVVEEDILNKFKFGSKMKPVTLQRESPMLVPVPPIPNSKTLIPARSKGAPPPPNISGPCHEPRESAPSRGSYESTSHQYRSTNSMTPGRTSAGSNTSTPGRGSELFTTPGRNIPPPPKISRH